MQFTKIPQQIKFKTKGDKNGSLTSLESFIDVPFDIKRVFYIYGTKENVIRGQHANKNSNFLFSCLVGSCKIKYYYNSSFHEVLLNDPSVGFFLPNMIWKDMLDFSFNAVLLVLSDTLYDPYEYIKDFKVYLNEIEVNK
jgi:hypothetical protein